MLGPLKDYIFCAFLFTDKAVRWAQTYCGTEQTKCQFSLIESLAGGFAQFYAVDRTKKMQTPERHYGLNFGQQPNNEGSFSQALYE